MNSPLYVLATSAASELIVSRRVSPDFVMAEFAPPALPRPSSLSILPSEQSMHLQRGQYEGLSMLETTSLVSSPGGVNLRVASTEESSVKRLDPYTIELIESVVAKGTGLLKQPFFPYTYETEPLRCMEIRIHLLRRYAPLQANADLTARVAFTKRLLGLWGAKLINTGDVPANNPTNLGTVPSPSRSPLRQDSHNQQPNDALRMVSPLKRTAKTSRSQNGAEDCENNDLTSFLMSNDSWEDAQADKDVAGPAPATSAAATATPAPQNLVDIVASKEILLQRHCKKQKLLAYTKKKQQQTCLAGQSVRRLVRRWTLESRQLYIKALETHGFGATESIRRMVRDKSYEQILQLGRALQEAFGIQPGEGPTDEIRECLR